jgi:hypothetical protein
MDPQVEAKLAPLLAQAATKLLMKNQSQMAQQQAQQQAQDPLVQMQQQELQLKAQAQAQKAQVDQANIQLKQQQLQLEAMKAQAQNQVEVKRVDVDAMKHATTILDQQKARKMDHGIDMVKTLAGQEHARTMHHEQVLGEALKTKLQPPKPKGNK